jgi:DNA adenine methylase
MKATRLDLPLKWHGGKYYLAPAIVALMPPRSRNSNAPDPTDFGWLHYVEAYAGGLSVLLANDPHGISEVVNDKHRLLSNFWAVLKDDVLFPRLLRRLEATPFSEVEWHAAATRLTDPDLVVQAEALFIYCRQSLAARMDGFAPFTRNRTRRGMNEQASAWTHGIDGLPAVHARLRRVVVYDRDALDVIAKQDGPRTLFYLDPPYLAETRAAADVYAHEMTVADHAALLDQVRQCRGRVMLSGYRSPLYDDRLREWNRHEFDRPNQAAGGKTKRRMTEVVWCNY